MVLGRFRASQTAHYQAPARLLSRSPIINLAYLGAVSLTAGMITLGVGLLQTL
jgi:hypothetical protein